MGDAEVPMRTGDEVHGSRLIVCELARVVVDAIRTGAPS